MRRHAILAVLAVLAACGSPNPDFYTLAALPGPVRQGATYSLELRRIGLAGYLDRADIVRSAAQYKLRVANDERWGEPLGGMVERVFTEDLVERLPNAAVFAESGAISTNPDRVLEIDVQRFDADADGTVVLLAQVAARRGDARQSSNVRTFRFTAAPASKALRDHVAAMSVALAHLADAVAGMLESGDAS